MALAACSTAREINARRVAQSFKASGFAFFSSRFFELENTALSMLHRIATLAGNSPKGRQNNERVKRNSHCHHYLAINQLGVVPRNWGIQHKNLSARLVCINDSLHQLRPKPAE
jgi:hypothetical protein